jgi:hypothetical protein
LSATLSGGRVKKVKGRYQLRYKEVVSAGKVRPLGIPSVEFDLLGPLHKTIYGFLREKEWLLCGRPSSSRVRSTCRYKFQTSIDLKGATDGLRLDVTECLLSALLSKATSIPGRVREAAFLSLRPFVAGAGEVTHGQMMGSYLSFPLLCLNSFCAASWAARGNSKVGLLVNGDDTLISSDLSDVKSRYPPGFEINYDKTVVSESVAEINSTTFLKIGGSWKEVRSLRRGGGEVTTVEGVRHMATACVNAGPKWISSFVRSGFGKKYKVCPYSLGLPSWNLDAYNRNISLGARRVIPVVIGELDDRLAPVYDEVSYAEQTAVRCLLFDEGRFDSSFKGFVKRTPLKSIPLTGRRMRSYLSYVKPVDQRRIDKLTEPFMRRITGFVVKDWSPTVLEKKFVCEEDGDFFLVDPNRLW